MKDPTKSIARVNELWAALSTLPNTDPAVYALWERTRSEFQNVTDWLSIDGRKS